MAPAVQAAVGERQYGVGRKAGLEEAIHTARAMSEARPAAVWVPLDASNAFNSLWRSHVRAAVSATVPALAAYARSSLDRRSRDWYQTADGGYRELTAEEGVDHGAPLSPAFFAVGVAGPLRRLEGGRGRGAGGGPGGGAGD